jgi:hypothetical protein
MHAAATDLRKTIHVKMHEEKIGGFLDLQIPSVSFSFV